MAANPITTPALKLVPEHKETIEDKVAELRHKRAKIELGGGKQRIEKQHADGKLTAASA
jgi:acetyl-CoA carboxylase carboxyltransferase component